MRLPLLSFVTHFASRPMLISQTLWVATKELGKGRDENSTYQKTIRSSSGNHIGSPGSIRNNDADGQAFVTQAVQGALRSWAADGGIDQPVGIDQIAHGRSMGRVPSSRPR